MGAITLPLCRWASRGPEKAQDVLLSDGVTIFIYRLSFSYMGESQGLDWIRYLKRNTGHYPIALKGSWVLFGRTLQARSLVRWNTTYWIRQGLNLQISKQKKILSLGEEKGSLNGLTETLCIFTFFFFSLQDNRILSRSWFTLSVDLSTWDGFDRPEAKSFVSHWPGLLYHLIRVPPLPWTAEHPCGHIYCSNENLTSKQSPGNSIVFHAESLHLKNNPLCLTNEKEGVTTHFSGWVRIPRAVILFLSGKCFGFLMLFCRLVPSQPLLQGPHINTCTPSCMHSVAFSTLPCWGLGMAASFFQHLQNKNEVGQ